MYVDIPQSTADLLRLRRSLESGDLIHDPTSVSKVKVILDDGSVYPLEGTFQFQDIKDKHMSG